MQKALIAFNGYLVNDLLENIHEFEYWLMLFS